MSVFISESVVEVLFYSFTYDVFIENSHLKQFVFVYLLHGCLLLGQDDMMRQYFVLYLCMNINF